MNMVVVNRAIEARGNRTTEREPGPSARPALAAFAWVAFFILAHIYWFLGGRIGFGDQVDPIPEAPTTPGGVLYNAIVFAMFLAGLVVPLALVQPWARRIPDRVLLALAWLGCIVLVLRGAAGIVDGALRQTGILPNGLTGLTTEQITGSANPSASTLWWSFAIDAYFVLGGILFGLAARAFWQASRLRR